MLKSPVAIAATVPTVASVTAIAIAPTITAAFSATATVASVATTAIPPSTTTAATVSAAATGTVSTTPTTTITTAIAATVITAASVTATTRSTTTAATSVLLFGLLHSHLLTAYRSVVQRFDSLAGLRLVRHVHKPKTLTLPRLPVHHDLCKIHCAIQFKHLFQVYIIKIRRKTCNKKLHADRFKR